MPYQLIFTEDKRKKVIELIIQLHAKLQTYNDVTFACLIVCEIHELFCANYFINTDASVYWNLVTNRMNVDSRTRTLAYLIKQFRDQYIHLLLVNATNMKFETLLAYNEMELVQQYCAEFTDDHIISYILHDSINKICEHYSRRY